MSKAPFWTSSAKPAKPFSFANGGTHWIHASFQSAAVRGRFSSGSGGEVCPDKRDQLKEKNASSCPKQGLLVFKATNIQYNQTPVNLSFRQTKHHQASLVLSWSLSTQSDRSCVLAICSSFYVSLSDTRKAGPKSISSCVEPSTGNSLRNYFNGRMSPVFTAFVFWTSTLKLSWNRTSPSSSDSKAKGSIVQIVHCHALHFVWLVESLRLFILKRHDLCTINVLSINVHLILAISSIAGHDQTVFDKIVLHHHWSFKHTA